MQAVDDRSKENNGPWTSLKKTLQKILTFSSEVIEEVIERNGEDERAFVAEVQEEAEQLRQNAAAQHANHQAA